jgi:vacuolar iron transporter family protein
MAAGEFVSVSQQADTERADVEKERKAQEAGPESRAVELRELADIYKSRGLDAELAMEVAKQLSAHDVVRAHAHDELNIDIDGHPNPWQAAFASAVRCRCTRVLLRVLCV